VPERNPLDRFNCGPITFTGDANALYERHLTFDQVTPAATATPRDKFEAVAHSIRDLLSQRWLRTEQTYSDRNVKRVYYVSLEFLMGRALANNVTNLILDPVWGAFCKKHKVDLLEIIEQEPDAGLGNGGLGRLAACFLDSMATLSIPGMGSGLRYEYGIFRQSIDDGWQFLQQYFLVACTLADAVRRFRAAGSPRADADPARCGGAWLGRCVGPDNAHAGLHQSHVIAGSAREVAVALVRAAAAPPAATTGMMAAARTLQLP
jgi:Carbohydrate phosphorylase